MHPGATARRLTRARPGWSGWSALGAWAAWAAFTAFAAVQVFMAVRRPGGPDGMSDLGVYTGAVRALVGGGSLYDFASANGDRFVYPPFAGLLLVPVAALPELAGRVVWTLLGCVEVVVLAWVVVRRSPLPALAALPRGCRVPLVAGVLMLTYPVFSGLFLGQVSLLVTLLALLDLVDLTPRWCRGVLLGLAAAVKLTPLALVPYLWLTGRRRAAARAAGAFVLAGVVAGWAAPAETGRYLAAARADHPFIDLGQADNASLVGLLTRTARPDAPGWAVLLPVVALLVVWSCRRAARAYRQGQVLAGAVVVGAMTVLVSPVSWSHHQVLLVLAAACTVGAGQRRAAAWPVGVLLLTSVPVQAVLLHLGDPGPVLRESGALLALAIACAVPFGPVRTSAARAGRTALRTQVDASGGSERPSAQGTWVGTARPQGGRPAPCEPSSDRCP